MVVGVGLVGAHEVDAGEKLVGGVDAVEVLAGNVEELRQTRASGDKDGVKAFVAHELLNGDALAYDDVGLELNTEAAEIGYLAL